MDQQGDWRSSVTYLCPGGRGERSWSDRAHLLAPKAETASGVAAFIRKLRKLRRRDLRPSTRMAQPLDELTRELWQPSPLLTVAALCKTRHLEASTKAGKGRRWEGKKIHDSAQATSPKSSPKYRVGEQRTLQNLKAWTGPNSPCKLTGHEALQGQQRGHCWAPIGTQRQCFTLTPRLRSN